MIQKTFLIINQIGYLRKLNGLTPHRKWGNTLKIITIMCSPTLIKKIIGMFRDFSKKPTVSKKKYVVTWLAPDALQLFLDLY